MKAINRMLHAVKVRICKHEFTLSDLKMVNPDGGSDRVQWPCSKCGKVFKAHCGLDIVPANGYCTKQ